MNDLERLVRELIARSHMGYLQIKRNGTRGLWRVTIHSPGRPESPRLVKPVRYRGPELIETMTNLLRVAQALELEPSAEIRG